MPLDHPGGAEIELLVRREDLNHPHLSGNKWWKWKGIVQNWQQVPEGIITYGGAHSNHLVATAWTCKQLGIPSIAIVRGEMPATPSDTLKFVHHHGMETRFVSRTSYREKNTAVVLEGVPKYHVIPEGASTLEALRGVMEWAAELNEQHSFDAVCLPVGTGGTMAGLVAGLRPSQHVYGFSVLKGEFHAPIVQEWLTKLGGHRTASWEIIDASYGGYARNNSELIKFIDQMQEVHNLPLEHVYTGKMMKKLFELLQQGILSGRKHLLVLHTGGLSSMRSLTE